MVAAYRGLCSVFSPTRKDPAFDEFFDSFRKGNQGWHAKGLKVYLQGEVAGDAAVLAPHTVRMRVTTPSTPETNGPGLPGVEIWLPVVFVALAGAIADVKWVTLLTLHERTRAIDRDT